ncbi:MAG: ZIP family metal transporter [Alcanivorax sediminis]|uniref:ZIP family metal transporter n=1 Tax=Alcanivorax sediminis TaxID=2663008 RepID=UPI003C679D0D
MNPLTLALLLSLAAGLSMAVGALIAVKERIARDWLRQEVRHTVIAFGGGALLAAVALVLVPEGAKHHTPLSATLLFMGGGIVFMLIDRALAAKGGAMSQLLAMLLDFVPEAIALGAALAVGGGQAYLLAFLIGLQNLPEGFNAYREIRDSEGLAPAKIILAFTGLAILGPISAWLGFAVLVDMPIILGGIMLFASGGILYLVFQDIAPQVPLTRAWAPSQGAVAGFALGLVGHLLVG